MNLLKSVNSIKITIIFIAIFFFLFVIGCNEKEIIENKITGRITGNFIKEINKESAIIPIETNKEIAVYFCPVDNCEKVLIDIINSSTKSIYCAFFDINLKNLTLLMSNKSHSVDTKLVVDNENSEAITGSRVKNDTSSQYSHNKFCVIDNEIVATGSFNPTYNDAHRNNNNLLIIHSKYLAENYGDEFKELWAGKFGKGEKVKYPVINLNNNKIENYFCPEDSCSEKIINEINMAEKNIYFMTFTFTDEDIANAILFNNKVDIKGIFEKRNALGRFSQYQRLKDFGMDIKLDDNPYSMHHKVFILDNQTVITGSMNPTESGDKKNDENILIIHNEEIAKKYVEEFERLFYKKI